MITEDFAFLLQEYGSPTDPVFPTEQDLGGWRHRLPKSLLDFWNQAGLGAWGHGIFRFCKPDDYQHIVNLVFDGDPEINSGDCAIYGYSAFAELKIWHRALGDIKADLLYGAVEADFVQSEQSRQTDNELGPDRVIASSLMSVVEHSDLRDQSKKPLFDRAVRKLGAPQPGECFGFVPALALGGGRQLEYLRRVRALEHFSILAQLRSFNLVRFDDNMNEVIVRPIGR